PIECVGAEADSCAVGGRVLLVEDDPATRVALRELLDDAGYAPTEAADGETALEALSAGAYDLLLLDLGLPGISGGAVREIVRRDPRTRFLPIVLLSARAELEAKVAELRAGADDYITKPYDADELLARCGGADRVVGHIGGDDFVMLADADESERLASVIARRFDEIAPTLYDEVDQRRGSIEARDRRRHLRRMSFATLSIGIVNIAPGR